MKALRNYLIDSYNGIYKIVLEPHMPTFVTVFAVVVAMLFGLLWGYVLRPVEYYNGSPAQMSEGARDQWIQLVAAANTAGFYNEADIQQLLNQVENPAENIQQLINSTTGAVQQGLIELLPLATATDANGQPVVTGTPAPNPNNIGGDIFNIVLVVILTIIGALVISPIWRLLFKPNIVTPIYESLRPKSQEERDRQKQRNEELKLIRDKKEREEKMRQESAGAASSNPYGAPITQKLSIYTKGRAYDDSFAIEDEDNNFYGETGATIAKQNDNGDLVAIEVWLFDKEDFVRTLVKLFVAEAAYNDPAVRAELEPRVDNPATDIIPARQGSSLTLETDALLVGAKIIEAQLDPTSSYFDGITIQMEAWTKQGGGAPAGGQAPAAAPVQATPSMQQFSQSTYTPPMPTQAGQAPTYTPPMPTPSKEPPPSPVKMPPPPERKDDDPFGGTGDFTPIGN